MEERETSGSRTLTERLVADIFSIDRLELYLAASELRVGRYDSMTHLLSFTLAEVQRIAARLEIPWKVIEERLAAATRRAGVSGVPEPAGE